MRKRSKTYLYFFVAALLLQLIAILKLVFLPETIDTALNLNLFGTQYVIGELTLIELVVTFYFLLGLGYWVLYRLKRRPNITLSNIHAFITVGGLALYMIANPIVSFIEDDPYGSYHSGDNTLLILLLPIVGAVQLLYIINIFIGIQTPYHTHRHKKENISMKKLLPVFCLFIAICCRAQDVQRQNATYSPLETIITDLNADTVNDTISLYETPVAGDPGKFRKMNVSVNGRRMTFFAKDAWISIDDDPFVKENNNAVKSNLAYVYKEKAQSFVILFGRATPGGREEVFILRVKDRKMEIVFHNSIEEPQFFTDLNNDGHVELIAWALPEFRANEKGEAISIYTPYRVYSLTPFFDIDKDLTEKYNKEHYVWAGLQYNKAIEVLYPNDGSKPKLIKTN